MKYVFSHVQLPIFQCGLNTHFELNPCALSLSTSLEESKWKNEEQAEVNTTILQTKKPHLN